MIGKQTVRPVNNGLKDESDKTLCERQLTEVHHLLCCPDSAEHSIMSSLVRTRSFSQALISSIAVDLWSPFYVVINQLRFFFFFFFFAFDS